MSVVQGSDILSFDDDDRGIAGVSHDLAGWQPARRARRATTARKATAHTAGKAASRSAAVAGSADGAFRGGVAAVLRTAAPLIAADLLALAVTALLAFTLLHLLGMTLPLHRLWVAPAGAALIILAYASGGLYPGIGIHSVVELRQLTKLTTTTYLMALLACTLERANPAWGIFLSLGWLPALVLMPLSRAAARRACVDRHWWGCPAVVIAGSTERPALVRTLAAHPRCGLRPAVALDVAELPDVDALRAAMSRRGIRHALVSIPADLPTDAARRALDGLAEALPHVLLVQTLMSVATLWTTHRSCGTLATIELRDGLALPSHRLIKRISDLALVGFAMVLSAPVMLALAAAVKLTSRGPAFYGQRRIGLGGRTFRAWKFRTMRADADAVLRHYLDEHPELRAEWERDHKLKDDPRVTRLGHFMRKTSLDEMPQLWNVLRGEMSLVGPRPIVQDEVSKYGEIFRQYTRVVPGITGLWQVSGRNNTTYAERVELDHFYVRNWSPWFDAYILAKTVATLLTRDGAY